MAKILSFTQIYEINEYLKEQGIGYRIHGADACGGAILELKQVGDTCTAEDVCKHINVYLKASHLAVAPVRVGSYDIHVI